MMPATRAACSGSPFLTCPLRTAFLAAAVIVTSPRAIASRVVTALPPTSTMRTRPCASACVSLAIDVLRQEKRQALERYREIHALQFDRIRHLQRTWGKVEDRLDARRHHEIDDMLRVRRGNGDDGDRDSVPARDPLQIVDVVNLHAEARLLA